MQHPSAVFRKSTCMLALKFNKVEEETSSLDGRMVYSNREGGIDGGHLEDKVSHTSSVSIRWLWKKFPLSFPI